MTTTIERLRKLKKSKELTTWWKVSEFATWVLRSWEQIPRMLWNISWLVAKWLWKTAGAIWEVAGVEKKDNIFYTWWLRQSEELKQLWEDITRAGEKTTVWWLKWVETEEQRRIRRTAGELALTAPVPIKWAWLIKWKWIFSTIWRWALWWVEWMATYIPASEWRLATWKELLWWAVWWAVAWPLLEKAVIPAISKTISKTLKYWTAGVKWWVGWLSKSITRDIKRPFTEIKTKWISPTKSASLSTKANRFKKWKEEAFQKMTWKSTWEYATERWMFKVWDEAVDEATNLWQKSMKEADDAIWLIDWKFKIQKWTDYMWEMLDDLSGRLTKTLSKDAKKVNLLNKKYRTGWLSMSEINDIKRIYSRNHKYSFVDAWWEAALKSKNLQDWVRKWQFSIAKKQWLKNLNEINKTTQAWKFYADNLAENIWGKWPNNLISLTDWVALSWWEPTNIALFLWKKTLWTKWVKSAIIKKLWKQTKPSTIKASRESILKSNIKKQDVINRNIFRDRSGIGVEQPLALPVWKTKDAPKTIIRPGKKVIKTPTWTIWRVPKKPWTTKVIKKPTKTTPKTIKKPTGKYWKGWFVNPWQITKDVKTWLKTLTPKNITTTANKIAKQLWVKATKVKELLKWYVKKYWADLKNKIWEIFDDLADKLGVRSKFIQDTWKKIDDFWNDVLDTLNPTWTVVTKYIPSKRANSILDKNKLTTLDKTMWVNSNKEITIYRWAPKTQKAINEWDFVTTNYNLAKDYAWNWKVLELKVKAKDVLDDIWEPLWEEYLYISSSKQKWSDTFNKVSSIKSDLIKEAKKVWLFDNAKKYDDVKQFINSVKNIHRPPDITNWSPLYDLTNSYWNDIYSSNAIRYYWNINYKPDINAITIIKSLKNNPEKEIKIYRAIEKWGREIFNSWDWVSITKKYAQEHWEWPLKWNYKIVEKNVKAKDIIWNADSLQEYWYRPNNHKDFNIAQLKEIYKQANK